MGDYVQLRRKSAYKEALKKGGLYKMDRRLVFADEASKANRSNGKVRKFESGSVVLRVLIMTDCFICFNNHLAN